MKQAASGTVHLSAMLLTLFLALTIGCRAEAVNALHGDTGVGEATGAMSVPSQRSLLALNTVQEGDIICPDRVTPARTCIDIPPFLKNNCTNTKCPADNTCKMVSCPASDGSTQCIPVCVQRNFKPTPGKCPADYPEVQCSKPGVCNLFCAFGKQCISNTCGNCTALCVDKPNNDLQCVDGPPVECLVDPCKDKTCSAGRVCVSEYCGGCNAGCVLKKPCPNGNTRHACLGSANRCQVVRCGFESTCVPDQCNNCAAVCVPPCPPGQYVSTDTASCTHCSVGYYCPGGTGTEPLPCNKGMYADRRGLCACKKCAAGTTTPSRPEGKGYTKCM